MTKLKVRKPSVALPDQVQKALWILVPLAVIAVVLVNRDVPAYGASSSSSSQSLRMVTTDYKVDEACKKLPTIRPSGSYFLDGKISAGVSTEDIVPAFKVGSYYAQKVPYHMATDKANFLLIAEALRERNEKGGIAIDFGANQGFYTYYLATLGLDVHSFEINEANFRALQHGAEFNPREVSDRVNLYPVGMGQTNARFGMKGGNYEGFLKEGQPGPILGATFDCFAHHTAGKLDLSRIAFVKLDVEGFEVAVLKGAQNSLFRKTTTIKSMIAEVGPDRWKRASVPLEQGIEEMVRLAGHFRTSYLLARAGGGYAKECPTSLGDDLRDKAPRDVENLRMFKVAPDEWKGLLTKMQAGGKDCNFFYKN